MKKERILISTFLLIFIVGDTLTTFIGIQLGLSESMAVSRKIINQGWVYFIFMKLFSSLVIILCNIIIIKMIENLKIKKLNNIYIKMMYINFGTIIGMYATLNNIYHIFTVL